jgi:heptosyltransferase-2
VHKILIIRLSSLGDVVLTLPVFKNLRSSYPDARIVALVKDTYAEVLRGETSIDEVMTFKRGESIFSLCHRVRREKFGMILDLHSNIRSRLVCWFSGAARIVRYRKATLARRLFVGWRFNSDELKSHTLDRYLEALGHLDTQHRVLLSAAPKKILVIQTAFLGDAVLTTPLLGAIHQQFPQARLSVLCTPQIADVFARHPAVSDVMVFDKRGAERSWTARWTLVKRLSSEHFDLAIIPHRSLTSALAAYLAGIPRRVGFSASQGRWFLTDVVPFRWGVHDINRNLALMNVFGVQNPSGELWLKPDPAAVRRVAERLQSVGVRQTLIGINAGSVWATKRWLSEGFAVVADRMIRELDASVIFVGGDRDSESIGKIFTMMKEKPINWIGKTSLQELVALIARCQAFLTNDSGPLHIAVASQVPTVAIFGPTTRELGFFPYGPGHRVIERDLDCRPCGLHGADRCPLGHFRCMKDISADEVFEAVKGQLRR